MMGRFLDLEPSHYDFNDAVKAGYMLSDEMIWVHGSSPGLIYITDATGLSLGHLGRINPMSIKKFSYYIQNAFPVRLKMIHIINMSPVAELLFNMFKPFIKAELINLVRSYSTYF